MLVGGSLFSTMEYSQKVKTQVDALLKVRQILSTRCQQLELQLQAEKLNVVILQYSSDLAQIKSELGEVDDNFAPKET
jgi:hypothetical protein